jgi:phenylacetate-CoA ligase
MAKIVGRCDDMLIIRGVNVFPSQIEELILRIPGLAPHYQLEVCREGHLDSLTVHVECASKQESGVVALERFGQELAHAVKAYVGITVGVAVHPLGVLERSTGKAKHVLDKRQL